MSSKHFILTFDPKPCSSYPNGYWCCYAEPGYDGSGATVEAAMAECIIEMSKALAGHDETTKDSNL